MSESDATLQQLRQFTAALGREVVRAKQKAAAVEAELMLMRQSKSPRFPIEFTAQFAEDVFAWDMLDRQTKGFFVEVGAFDGYHFSVTYPFESIGWTGLLVEPHPDASRLCAARRTNSEVVHAAVGRRGASGATQFTVVQDDHGGMGSYHTANPRHLSRLGDKARHSVEVPLTTLGTLLADHTGPIDLAIIDVEGAEADVLDGFDLDRLRPRLLLVENNHDPAVGPLMDRHGYQYGGTYRGSHIFVWRDEHDIADRVAWFHR